MNLERRIERLKTANQKWKQVNEDLQNTNNSLRKRIKDLEADKLRQESYHEALVNENKKLETDKALLEVQVEARGSTLKLKDDRIKNKDVLINMQAERVSELQESLHKTLELIPVKNERIKQLEDEISHLKAKLDDEHLRKMNRIYEARKSKEQRSED